MYNETRKRTPGTVAESRGIVQFVDLDGSRVKRHSNQLRPRQSRIEAEAFETLFDLCETPPLPQAPETHPPEVVEAANLRPRRIRLAPSRLQVNPRLKPYTWLFC
ncbi:hypothetical protein Ciccas_003524, partial [Cichlidogyrus casuarinus]